jgi:hypothetical protein
LNCGGLIGYYGLSVNDFFIFFAVRLLMRKIL